MRSVVSDVSWSSKQAGSTAVGGRPSVHDGVAAKSSNNQRRVIIKRGRAGGGAGEENIKKMYARAACGMCFSCTLYTSGYCNGFFFYSSRAYITKRDGSDSYLILDIPTVPHSRLNEPLSTRTV